MDTAAAHHHDLRPLLADIRLPPCTPLLSVVSSTVFAALIPTSCAVAGLQDALNALADKCDVEKPPQLRPPTFLGSAMLQWPAMHVAVDHVLPLYDSLSPDLTQEVHYPSTMFCATAIAAYVTLTSPSRSHATIPNQLAYGCERSCTICNCWRVLCVTSLHGQCFAMYNFPSTFGC